MDMFGFVIYLPSLNPLITTPLIFLHTSATKAKYNFLDHYIYMSSHQIVYKSYTPSQ